MANSDRRRFLKGVLASLAASAGTVVLASSAPAQQPADQPATGPQPEQPGDIQDRAEQIANTASAAEGDTPVSAFVNGAFRNVGFRNGGFANVGFRNGGFANGGGGGFRNGGFANGAGGGFRNGAFRNF